MKIEDILLLLPKNYTVNIIDEFFGEIEYELPRDMKEIINKYYDYNVGEISSSHWRNTINIFMI